jgi:cell division protein FtsN
MSLGEEPVRHGVTLTRPQIIALAFVAVVVAGLAMSLGYVGGRTLNRGGGSPSVKSPESESQDGVLSHLATQARPKTSGASFVELPPPPSEDWESPGPQARAAHARGFVQRLSLEPKSGQRFLQVAEAGRGVADCVSAELVRRGFKGQIVAGKDTSAYRVLVGPLQSAEIASTTSALRRIGFSPFQRVY